MLFVPNNDQGRIKKVFAAVVKSMPCFLILIASLSSSHTKIYPRRGYFFVHNHFLRYYLILFGFLQKHNARSFPLYPSLVARRLITIFVPPRPSTSFSLELKPAFMQFPRGLSPGERSPRGNCSKACQRQKKKKERYDGEGLASVTERGAASEGARSCAGSRNPFLSQ